MAHPEYPCLGARSVFRRDAATLVVLDDLADTSPGGSLDTLGAALGQYADEVDADGDLVSFVACFRGPVPEDEREFEALLWGALQHLHDHDDAPWADGVAADPENPHFAFSVAGTAFFVVGLHPNASRVARRAPAAHPRLQPPRAVRADARRRPLPAHARHDPPARHRPAGLPQPDGERPRRDVGGPAVRRARRAPTTGRRRSNPTRMPSSAGPPGRRPVNPARTRFPSPGDAPAYDGSADGSGARLVADRPADRRGRRAGTG